MEILEYNSLVAKWRRIETACSFGLLGGMGLAAYGSEAWYVGAAGILLTLTSLEGGLSAMAQREDLMREKPMSEACKATLEQVFD